MKEGVVDAVLNKLLLYVQNTENFLVKETPEYIQQLLEYNVVVSYLNILYCGVGLVIFATAGGVGAYLENKKDGLGVPYRIVGGIGLVISLTFTVCVVPHNINKIVKINTAPKVYIVDYLRGKTK